MKKKILVAVLIVFSLLVVAVIGLEIRYQYYHGGSPSGKGWYADETVEDNGEFVLKTNIMEADGIEIMSFHIENKKGEIIFDSDGGWRTKDLHGIYFVENNNDVIVDTGDVGKILFEYNGETWICEDDVIEEVETAKETLPWKDWH
ncbi:MAG: hypothetical protein E7529_01040 [Ruminococcaceae bacterium]|nr:hypothetical protein [Oscillospiraceae bacterium]